MKKTVVAFAAALALVGMGACSSNSKKCNDGECKADKAQVFCGVLPAADAEGVEYTLDLKCDSTCTAGTFKLDEVYLKADSVGAKKEGEKFSSKGDFTVQDQNGKKYLKLVKAAANDSVESPIYFLVDSDSTLTMVNQDLQVSETPGLNYTLTLKK